MQNATFPMITAIAINIINISLNLFFVFGLKMRVEGIALGETISQYAGLIISLIFIAVRYSWINKYFQFTEIFNLPKLKVFFKVNTDILIRTFCIIAVFTLFTSKSAGINDTTLASNTLLLQFLLSLGSTGIGDGIAVPHVRNPVVLHVSKPTVTLCFLDHPIDFGAIDDMPVDTMFAIVSPSVKAHLHLLSRLAFVLRDPGFKAALRDHGSRPPRVCRAASMGARQCPSLAGRS